MEILNIKDVIVEIEKGKNVKMNYNNAIEYAVNEYFCNNRIVKINNKDFDVMNYGNYKVKLAEF